ncbi:ALA-interacting subunit [Seminavis robusta]|uniref:ALA-interacting subunit n=1 Tax=Seminavis robusta TaxID=568900 RepID=A0A9N8H1V4_9STRA|nr:ALA-interacting subunit [Seminavis robusta]|eukprot:Sro24_g016250.1 ALA-interacting subunit (413) ;mRNA; r:14788-16116
MPATKKDDDDETVLSLSEQTNRPADVALNQQRIAAWHPILDPVWVIIALFYLGVIMVPVGFKMQDLSNGVVELRKTYDSFDDPNLRECGINTTYNARRKCSLEFIATQYMEPPILVHYELTNFHQNHRDYYQSRDAYQLYGRSSLQQTSLEASLCDPLNKLGNVWLNPCGLIANTFFNDIFTLESGQDAEGNTLNLIEKGVAWASDIEFKFKQPDGFAMEACENPTPNNINADGTTSTSCDPDCCLAQTRTDDTAGLTNQSWSCSEPAVHPDDGKCYRYHYPDEEITQYLYETYPDVVNPLEGVTNEHFIVWMRIATLPTFRKLYGYFNEPIAKGSRFTIQVEANYVVESFKGSKSIIISTNNIFGGQNPVLGRTFIVVGFICIVSGLFFTMKHWLRPRKLADTRYLHFKED